MGNRSKTGPARQDSRTADAIPRAQYVGKFRNGVRAGLGTQDSGLRGVAECLKLLLSPESCVLSPVFPDQATNRYVNLNCRDYPIRFAKPRHLARRRTCARGAAQHCERVFRTRSRTAWWRLAARRSQRTADRALRHRRAVAADAGAGAAFAAG